MKTRVLAGMMLGIMLALSMGCASNGASGSDASVVERPLSGVLTGSEWRLLEFQSMSDQFGTTYPDDPSLYTITFRANGTVSLLLNCNRGTGTWTAKLTSQDRGTMEFSPLAVTRMLCPSPSLDERIARDMGYVRSFVIEGDRLFMSLMADGGIYVWERI